MILNKIKSKLIQFNNNQLRNRSKKSNKNNSLKIKKFVIHLNNYKTKPQNQLKTYNKTSNLKFNPKINKRYKKNQTLNLLKKNPKLYPKFPSTRSHNLSPH